MKSIVRLETSDEERKLIYTHLFGKPGMVSRKQLLAFVQEKVCEAIEGTPNCSPDPAPRDDDATGPPAKTDGDQRVSEFVPSRGDEGYLYKGQDMELAAKCSTFLDCIEYFQQYAWDKLERNRE